MAVAYAALAPLGFLLDRLLNSFRVSLHPQSKEMIEIAHLKIMSLQEVIDMASKLSNERVKPAMDRHIRKAVCRVEDTLESFLSNQYLSKSEKGLADDPDRNFPQQVIIDLKGVEQEIDSFITAMMKIEQEYIDIVDDLNLDWNSMPSGSYKGKTKEMEMESEAITIDDYLDNKAYCPVKEDGDDKEIEYKGQDFLPTSNYQMVGLVDLFVQLKSSLLRKSRTVQPIKSIVGMAGIGKTALAEQLFHDPLISNHFDGRAFVSIGQKYQSKQVIIDILFQLENHLDVGNMQSESESKLLSCLQLIASRKRLLFVLDDVWSNEICSDLGLSELNRINCRILMTTRIANLGSLCYLHGNNFMMPFLSEEESWSLLCEKVFGKNSRCPFELVKVGKKIAKHCDGLPLAITAVASLLAKGDKTLDNWKKVSKDANPLSIGTCDQHPMLDTLYSSYNPLSQHLKTCFLYMGVFPQRHEITASKLIMLWIAEGFVDCRTNRFISFETMQHLGVNYLEELSSQSVVLVTKLSSEGRTKICKLHSVFWHLCVGEARKEYLFQIVNKYSNNSFAEDIEGHRRVCVHNNTLFGIKDAYNSMSSMSSMRSLLCTGPHHDYPIPMCFDMRLLRVLHALTIRFYEFPLQVAKLVQLRYLALTYDGMLHASISQLWNLQCLIVQPHRCIVSPEASSYLPVEIWNMKELIHLQVRGALLPSPCTAIAILPKLSTVLGINAQSITAAVLCRIPNLRKLGIQIDLSSQDPFDFGYSLRHQNKLESLKCIIINPKPKSQVIAPPPPSYILPRNLVKLSLSGFGYPWERMSEIIGPLICLRVLKLRQYAFQGPEWEVDFSENQNLQVLYMEDLDLVRWRVTQPSSFCLLKHIVIKHCYRLQEIPLALGHHHFLAIKRIELVEVKPSVVASAKNLFQPRNRGADEWILLQVDCSWEDGK